MGIQVYVWFVRINENLISKTKKYRSNKNSCCDKFDLKNCMFNNKFVSICVG